MSIQVKDANGKNQVVRKEESVGSMPLNSIEVGQGLGQPPKRMTPEEYALLLPGVGTTVGTDEIIDGAVTLAKQANLAENRLIGRVSAGTGVPEAVVLDTDTALTANSDDRVATQKAVKAYAGSVSGMAQGAINQLFAQSPSQVSDATPVDASTITCTMTVAAGNATITCSADARAYVRIYSVVGTTAQAGKAGIVTAISADGLTLTTTGLGEDNPLATDAVASQLKVYGSPNVMGDPTVGNPLLSYQVNDPVTGNYIEVLVRRGFWTGPMFTAGEWYQVGGTASGFVIDAGLTSVITGITGHLLDYTPLYGKGADVAAANNLTLGHDGTTFTITGNTQINAITTAKWASGTQITLIFSGTPTVKHNTAGGAGTAVLFLSGSVDLVAAANTVLTLVYDGTQWQETGRKVA